MSQSGINSRGMLSPERLRELVAQEQIESEERLDRAPSRRAMLPYALGRGLPGNFRHRRRAYSCRHGAEQERQGLPDRQLARHVPARAIDHVQVELLEGDELCRLCFRPSGKGIGDIEVILVEILRRRVRVLMFQSWLAAQGRQTAVDDVRRSGSRAQRVLSA